MAIKIGGTNVFNNNAAIDWSLISSTPQYIASLIKTGVGDNYFSLSSSVPPATNVAYHSGNATLQIWFDTNCTPANCSDCGGPMGCFLGSEHVLMADGTTKRLDQVRPGERISCHFSGSAPVLGIRETSVHENKMFRINRSLITTGEHAFWSPSTQEWLVPDKSNDHRTTQPRRWVKDRVTGQQHALYFPQGLVTRQMKVGDTVLVGEKTVAIFSIEYIPSMPMDSPKLITLITTTSMYVGGGWLVSAWSGRDFNKPIDGDIERRLKMLRGELPQNTPFSLVA